MATRVARNDNVPLWRAWLRSVDQPDDRISISREAPVRIGQVVIDPRARSIIHDDGRQEILEPRMMQVLVALVRAEGRVVSRDELIDSCWDGRSVCDEAITTTIYRLRRVARQLAPEALKIETVAKVGYRLVSSTSAESLPLAKTPRPVWALAGAILLIACVLAVTLSSNLRSRSPAPTTQAKLAVLPAGSTENTGVWLARGLAVDLARLAGAHADQLAIVEPGGTDPDYRVRIDARRIGGTIRADASLVSNQGSELIWSSSFERPADRIADLRQQMAAKVGYVLMCALFVNRQSSRLEVAQLRLFLAMCEHESAGEPEQGLASARLLTERSPAFARGWACRAVFESLLGGPAPYPEQLDDDRRRALRSAARNSIARARGLDRKDGVNYLADAYLVLEPERWADRLSRIKTGLAIEPDVGWLHQSYGLELSKVGRTRESLESLRRAVAVDPLSPWHRAFLISALAGAGNTNAARSELAQLDRMWPDSQVARNARLQFELRYGDSQSAIRLLELDSVSDEERHGFARFLHARAEQTPRNVDAAIESETSHRGAALSTAIQTLGYFGRIDQAYAMLADARTVASLRNDTSILFQADMRAFRHDRRFMQLSKRLGLVDYWRASGRWPDFCNDPDLPYECRVEADRLTRSPRGRL